MSFRKGKVDKGEIISALEAIIKELRAAPDRNRRSARRVREPSAPQADRFELISSTSHNRCYVN